MRFHKQFANLKRTVKVELAGIKSDKLMKICITYFTTITKIQIFIFSFYIVKLMLLQGQNRDS